MYDTKNYPILYHSAVIPYIVEINGDIPDARYNSSQLLDVQNNIFSYDRRSLAQGLPVFCSVLFCPVGVIDRKNASTYLYLCQFNLGLYET